MYTSVVSHVPSGDITLNQGDVLVVVAEGKSCEEVLDLCRPPDDR
jgi:Trk K+ transport system NAD-binding subunit